MSGWQKIYAFIAAAAYLALFIVFIFYSSSDIFWECNYESPCIRFCSNDTKKYPTFELFTKVGNYSVVHFYETGYEVDENATTEELKYHSFWAVYREPIFTILRGEPSCDLKVVENASDREYEYLSWTGGQLSVKDRITFTANEYCFDLDDEEDIWNIKLCSKSEQAKLIFHYISILLSSAFIISTLYSYASNSELRDTRGKCLIYFLASLQLAHLILPITRQKENLIEFNIYVEISLFVISSALISSYLWLSVICYDINWNLRNFTNSPTEKDSKFSTYFTLIATISLISGLTITVGNFSRVMPEEIIYILSTLLIFTGVFDIILLSISAVLLSRLAKGTGVTELIGYIKEKEWNKRISLIMAMMIITWLIEIIAWDREFFNNLSPWIISDVVKLFTAFNIFVIFVMRKNVALNLIQKFRLDSN